MPGLWILSNKPRRYLCEQTWLSTRIFPDIRGIHPERLYIAIFEFFESIIKVGAVDKYACTGVGTVR